MKNTQTFAGIFDSFKPGYNLSVVFDDFLTMSLCSLTRNPHTGQSHYEDTYLEAMAKYTTDELRFQFPKLLDVLVNEMEEKINDSKGNDILGEYYEQHIAKKEHSQFFTPWVICEYMAKTSIDEAKKEGNKPLRILEPSCGSGRFIIASAKQAGPDNEFYGIDLDLTCVKMTALNLFLNGVFNAEVMCANALLLPDTFQVSYYISFRPLGIFKIEKKEESRLWHLVRNKLKANEDEAKAKIRDMKLPSESGEVHGNEVKQMPLF